MLFPIDYSALLTRIKVNELLRQLVLFVTQVEVGGVLSVDLHSVVQAGNWYRGSTGSSQQPAGKVQQ